MGVADGLLNFLTNGRVSHHRTRDVCRCGPILNPSDEGNSSTRAEERSLKARSVRCKDPSNAMHKRWMNMKPPCNQAYIPTELEHIANVITHALWVVPSLIGMLFLIHRSSTSSEYVSAIIYGISLVALFTTSTVFHSVFYVKHCGNLKEFLHRCDRAIIYVFIAASYTPWLLLKDMEPSIWGENLWWLVWLMAIMGITYQSLYHERYKMLETVFYLITGIVPAIAVFCMRECSGVEELSAGGVVYIVGILFFKSDGKIPCAHAIWHLFVSAGASCHFYAISKYLIGTQANN